MGTSPCDFLKGKCADPWFGDLSSIAAGEAPCESRSERTAKASGPSVREMQALAAGEPFGSSNKNWLGKGSWEETTKAVGAANLPRMRTTLRTAKAILGFSAVT